MDSMNEAVSQTSAREFENGTPGTYLPEYLQKNVDSSHNSFRPKPIEGVYVHDTGYICLSVELKPLTVSFYEGLRRENVTSSITLASNPGPRPVSVG